MSTNLQISSFLQRSRFIARMERKYPLELQTFPTTIPASRVNIAEIIDAFVDKTKSVGVALRLVRQMLLYRIIERDFSGEIKLEQVMTCLTLMAEESLCRAHHEACLQLLPLYGEPQDNQGNIAKIAIVGMGKLGARELNASSDIDLIYVYDEDGQTRGNKEGEGVISNQEYFAKLVKIIHSLLSDVTEHGFVFRVDLALRPNGNAGSVATSLEALQDYFLKHGREWERFAWLKSRIVAPAEMITNGLAQRLRSLVTPFVFREYLDYSVFDSLRQLHQQIRNHTTSRSVGRGYRNNDVKLSRGGIREIEFSVQLLQVVRGGQYPELRTRPTQSALGRLVHAALLTPKKADELAQCYIFLRRVEHFIQYLDDQQTHILPTNAEDLDWIARGMGFEQVDVFQVELSRRREIVALEFESLLGVNKSQEQVDDALANGKAELVKDRIKQVADILAEPLKSAVRQWKAQHKLTGRSDESQDRILALLLRVNMLLNSGQCSESAAKLFVDWLEPLLRREIYCALLAERPHALERLIRILGMAKWPAHYVSLHPGVIDELANDALLTGRFNQKEFESLMQNRYCTLLENDEATEETLLNLLRRAHHAEVFRTLVRDLEAHLTVEQVADDLSALAISLVKITVNWCWKRLKLRHCEDPKIGIIAYGKLGGLELGYGSDLDLVFVYEDEAENAGGIYAQLVKKVLTWLTVKTGEGDVYEIDTALRPNGNSGLLVSSFDAYANYQLKRGSNTAWTWEHQAMTRARCIYGSPPIIQRFNEIRESVMTASRDEESLKEEIISMRQKMRDSKTIEAGFFDVKHSKGGMIDIEFAVQYLTLSQSKHHPDLLANLGNIALLLQSSRDGLIGDELAQNAANSYRTFRQTQHHLRLNSQKGIIPDIEAVALSQAGIRLWQEVFNA